MYVQPHSFGVIVSVLEGVSFALTPPVLPGRFEGPMKEEEERTEELGRQRRCISFPMGFQGSSKRTKTSTCFATVGPLPAADHSITESLRLERTLRIVESNH